MINIRIIKHGTGDSNLLTCPECSSFEVKYRKLPKPKYICDRCGCVWQEEKEQEAVLTRELGAIGEIKFIYSPYLPNNTILVSKVIFDKIKANT